MVSTVSRGLAKSASSSGSRSVNGTSCVLWYCATRSLTCCSEPLKAAALQIRVRSFTTQKGQQGCFHARTHAPLPLRRQVMPLNHGALFLNKHSPAPACHMPRHHARGTVDQHAGERTLTQSQQHCCRCWWPAATQRSTSQAHATSPPPVAICHLYSCRSCSPGPAGRR